MDTKVEKWNNLENNKVAKSTNPSKASLKLTQNVDLNKITQSKEWQNFYEKIDWADEVEEHYPAVDRLER